MVKRHSIELKYLGLISKDPDLKLMDHLDNQPSRLVEGTTGHIGRRGPRPVAKEKGSSYTPPPQPINGTTGGYSSRGP